MLNIAHHYGKHATRTRCGRAFPNGKIPCHGAQRITQGNALNEFRNWVGAHARIRTGDLFLTKEMLYRLSYVGGLGSDSICYILRTSFMATVDGLLERARARLKRVDAKQAAAELGGGALLVDTRTDSQRAAQGAIPGARVIDRTVLEWRLDPTSPWRIPEAENHEVRVMVVCSEGYSSSLAAASLQDLGLVNATDVIGGFQAWKAAGLPVRT